jgi:hypothetical protein
MGFSQLHNPKKHRKDGAPIGGAQGTIEVHFADGVPHLTMLQAKEVPLQLGNWRGKVDLLVSTLGGMDCILGMEFITQNNVLIEGHNRLVRISFKSGIVLVKAHKLPYVGGSTIHFDAFLSPLLDPLEGLSMLNCGKLGLEGRSRLSALKGGRGAC